MNPLLVPTLRRHWPLVGALAVLASFLLVHFAWFRPGAARLEQAFERASELGLALDPQRAEPMMPPRLFALLSENALPPAEAQERGASGALVAELLDEMTQIASRHGMAMVTTQPGAVTPQGQGLVVRAHLRVRARYDEFVAFLDTIARSGRLDAVDRFAFGTAADQGPVLDIWVSRYVLVRPGETP